MSAWQTAEVRIDPRLTIATLALVPFVASCSEADERPDSVPTTTPTLVPSSASAEELCLNGVRKSPREKIRVERAFAASVSAVRNWVLAEDPDIDWNTFASSLADAPLEERVGVCVLAKIEGALFTHAPGVNTPEPTEAVLMFALPDGKSTTFMMGSTADMLDAAPTSLP